MKPVLLVAFACVWLALLAGCNQTARQAMKFRVNPALLGNAEQDTALQITYAAPVTFTRFSEEEVIKQRQSALQKEEGVKIQSVYQDTRSQAFMVVSALSKDRWQQLKKQIGESGKDIPSQTWNTMNTAEFEHNNFSVQQWLLQNQDWVNFKLMFRSETGRYFQVDYLVPSTSYDQTFAHAIESSIGSFKSL